MDQDQIIKIIKEKVGIETIILLKNYDSWGVLSRTFMLKQHDEIFQALVKREGKYSTYPEEVCLSLEKAFILEVFERLCLVIEDFCTIASALLQDLGDFPDNILQQPNPQNILNNIKSESWTTLLRYKSLETLTISNEEKEFLTRLREKNISVLQNLIILLRDFVDVYWLPYTKFKHANTLLYSIEKVTIEGQQAIFIPAIYNRKKLEKVSGIIVNDEMLLKWRNLFDALIVLTKDLIQTAIIYITSGEIGFTERTTYCSISDDEHKALEEIIGRNDSERVIVPVDVKISSIIQDSTIQRFKELLKKFDLKAFSK